MLESLALLLALSGVGQIPGQVSAEPAAVGETVLIEFTATWCEPCRVVRPTVERIAAAGFPIRQVDIDQQPELAARYQITSVPSFVMVAEGREVDRVVGMASFERLEQMLARGGVRPPGGRLARGLCQSPDVGGRLTSGNIATSGGIPGGGFQNNAFPSGGFPNNGLSSPAGQTPRAAAVTPARTSSALLDQLISSTVRIKVDDAAGHSYGTGTIIDSRAGEALVLTCGHLFRDSDGKGAISIDLFSGGGSTGVSKTVAGRRLSYGLERDLGLLSIRPDGPVRVARVAARAESIVRGNRVVSVGCNNGQDPTALQTHVTAIDRYEGPPNIEAAGMPVEGRSGGGLFDDQGQLIGVCFAADSQDNEGLYAGLASIHAELDRLGLSDVYQTAEPPAAGIVAQPPQPAMSPQRAAPVQLTPSSGLPGNSRPSVVGANLVEMSPNEGAALAEIKRRAVGAEMICIIRPNDPQAKSEIIVLENVSAEFIERLTSAQRTRDTRQLTSLEVSSDGAAGGAVAVPAKRTDVVLWRDKRPRATPRD